MRFLRDALITTVVLVVVVGVVAYTRVRAGGLSADAEPVTLERTVARQLLRLSISTEAARQRNPFNEDTTAWRAAADHYADHCANCHGSDGHGRTEIGENMYPKVPDLADPAVQSLSDGAVFSIIQNGVRWTGMPSWKHQHSPEDTWKLVSFVRRVPSLTSTDLESLQHREDMDHHESEHHDGHDDAESHRPSR
jgi:mono/diheme cytochrome c family protein